MAKEKKQRNAAPQRRDWLESRWFPWALAAVYLLILLLVFSDFVFSNLMLYGSDTIQAQVYFKAFHIDSAQKGDLIPGWAPYLFGGMPFVDAFHSDIFYPVTLLLKLVLLVWTGLMPLYRLLGWFLILHFWLGGMGMYATAREWGIGRLPAAVAGLAYMVAPYFISMVHPGHDGKIFVTAWFPIGFLFLKRIWDSARARDIGVFGLIVGLIILTPHVQMAYFALWGYAGYSAYRIVQSFVRDKRLPWTPAIGALGGVLIAVGISAVQFYPGYYYVKNHSPRAGEGRGFEYATSWSLHPEEIISEVVPDFSGVAGKDQNTYWGRNFFKDNSEYGGLVALLLAVYAVFRTRFRDRWFFLGLGVFAALYGLGAHTPLFTVFYHLVPNVKQMRAPSMIMFLYLFAIALCAGAALDALWQRNAERASPFSRTKLLWIIAAVLGAKALLLSIAPSAMLSIYTSMLYSDISPERAQALAAHTDTIVLGFWLAVIVAAVTAYGAMQTARHAMWAIVLIAAVVLFDNVRMDRKFIQTISYAQYFPRDPVIDFLKAQPEPVRVLPAPRGFPTNYFPLYGIAEMTGYHGNQLRSYNTFLGGSEQPRFAFRQALDLDNIGYIVFRRGANLTGEPNDPSLEKVYDRGGVAVYQNVMALPYVRLVACWELHDPSDTLYARIWEPDFDYRNCVVADSTLPFESTRDTMPAGTARVVKYELEEVEIEVEAAREALLVAADNTYPSWHASIDGQPAPIVTTNATFRGVVVPAGKHTVRFQYHSDRLRAGAWITVVSALVAAMLIGGDIFRGRRRGA
jgi:hypothetical protein